MSKKDLIDAVADATELSKEKAGAVVDAVTAHIQKSMQNGGEVRLPGFGTFKVSKRKERTGRNPATKQEIKIPASIVPKFQAAKALKDALN
jgi:DNA-binding protein HU-beta